MAVENAPGHPAYSGTFIPEAWSTKLDYKFYKSSVFGEISNHDWEGEIKKHGDIVHIRTIPTITVSDYVKGEVTSPEYPESANVDLVIDKAKKFFVGIDSIDKYQSDLDLFDEWAKDAAEQMKIAIDTQVLGSIYSQVHASNGGATAGADTAGFNLGTTAAPVLLTKSNVYDYLIDINTVLDEQSIDAENRWAVIPPWFANLIAKSELKDASMTGDAVSIARNGRLGQVSGLTLFVSRNLAVVSTTTQVVVGHPKGLSFASQMTEMQHFAQLEGTFGQAMKGLNVYGFVVNAPEALARLVCKKG